MKTGRFRNPVLPGFNPDPSICRVGEDFYLVTSSFEYFPGVPVYHSRDLVHWVQIGNALERTAELPLSGTGPSQGIYAPTLRHHAGTYYLVTTLVRRQPDRFLNFVVTAAHPAGPWSKPVVLAESFWRIDPSLFFEDDGRCYFTANRTLDPEPYPGHRMISLQELDLPTLRLIGPVHDLGEGAFRQAATPEAPHLYRKDGYYYLIIAEGGTFDCHAVTASRSREVFGPYESAPQNPILTHRHLEPHVGIHAVGHADLIDTPTGDWWMVVLGIRGDLARGSILGRETFLVPVEWASGQFPVPSPGRGRVQAVERAPTLLPATRPRQRQPARETFAGPKLGPQWICPGRDPRDFCTLAARPGHLRITAGPARLEEIEEQPAFVARRLQHFDFRLSTEMDFRSGRLGAAAGVAVRNGRHYVALVKTETASGPRLQLWVHGPGPSRIVAELAAPAGSLRLRCECRKGSTFRFRFAAPRGRWRAIGSAVDASCVSHQAEGGAFTGACAGFYATSGGPPKEDHADFAYVDYEPIGRVARSLRRSKSPATGAKAASG